MRKTLLAITLAALLAAVPAFAVGPPGSGSGSGVQVAADCDVAAYYPIGTLCQDSGDGKLYKGTGAAVVEIAAGASGDLLANGTVPLTAHWDVGAFNITAAAFVPDTAANAAGEIGYTGGAYSWFATSEDLALTATENLWTWSSSTGATVAFTPSVALNGGATVGGALAIGANNLTMTGSLGATGARLTKGWFTDLEVTNAIAGSVTGNAATATALASNPTDCAAGEVANAIAANGNLTCTAFKPADLSIASQGAGDIVYFNGTNWVRLAKDEGKYLKSGASAVSWDTPAGGAGVDVSGTPANHYWVGWTDADTIKGFSITASKPICTDASGDPAVCAGTEGVWQVADADLTTWAGITPGANVGTFLATPSSANLASAVTDETGSGALVFGTSPTFTTSVTLPATITGGAAATWTLTDNQASGLSIGSTGKADIFKVVTTDGSEGVTMSGSLTVTGTLSAASITTTASSTPSILINDSDAPGTDKEIGKIVGAYIDGADGSENGTVSIYAHEAGTSTEYIQVDGKNATIDLLKPVVITGTQFKLPSSDADPTATAGYFRHDSSSTSASGGGLLAWHDGTNIRQVVDTGTTFTQITKFEYLPIRYAEDDVSVAAPAAAAEIGTTSLIARSFAEDADNGVIFFWNIPGDYVSGIKYRVYYALNANGQANETAAFALSGCAVGNSGALACAEGTAIGVTDELGTDEDTGELIVTDWSAAVTIADTPAAGKMASLLLIRDVSEDDYSDHLLVVGIEIKYVGKLNPFSDY